MSQVFKKAGGQNYMGALLRCPCCGAKFADQSIRMHVYHIARSEVWQKALGTIKGTPHFDLYKKSTVPVKNKTDRKWRV